jgi:hypothetical protein
MNHVRNMSSLTVRRWCTRTRHVCDCTILIIVHQIIMRVCETECGTVSARAPRRDSVRTTVYIIARRARILISKPATARLSVMATSHHPNHMWRAVVPINSTIFVAYNYGMAKRNAPDPTRPRTHLVLIAPLVVACLTVWRVAVWSTIVRFST